MTAPTPLEILALWQAVREAKSTTGTVLALSLADEYARNSFAALVAARVDMEKRK